MDRSSAKLQQQIPVCALLALLLLGPLSRPIEATKLVEVSILDKDFLIVHFSDGTIVHNEGFDVDSTVRYVPELDVAAATDPTSWTISSTGDPAYGETGSNPEVCHRKTKLSGHAQLHWVGTDFEYESTYDHWIYLKLPSSLQQGVTYALDISPATNSDTTSFTIDFDVFTSVSEAIHINLAGYPADSPHRGADLYHWMGDGGPRDYSEFEGNTVWLVDVATDQASPAGTVNRWMHDGGDLFWYNLIRSDVWAVDFANAPTPGTYRLVVEGVGSSQDFEIGAGVYRDPFVVALRGYFYTRVSETNPGGIVPPPRSPLYIPGISPPDTVVYRTSMHPWHPDWNSFSTSEPYDQPDDWAAYRLPGNPTNDNAWGGHADASDWDRHLQHVANIYDMLLPFIATNGAITDDDTGITESGNGIPDLLDEARYEVDFWLRLRDGDGYAHALTNPSDNNEIYQAGATPLAAWANAANAAMMAEACRLAGLDQLRDEYQIHAVLAYNYADSRADPMLDEGLPLDDGVLRGRDLKMMAAAFLYNVTGSSVFEDVVFAESVCADAPDELKNGSLNQLYGTAAYLLTPQPVSYPTLFFNMKTAVMEQAKSRETDWANERPSRRITEDRTGYFRTAQNVQRSIIAHAIAEEAGDRDLFRKGLELEASWGLGRNPLNMIQMTAAWTPLEDKRSVPEAFTSGWFDGYEGVHPGHTPYMNLDDWFPLMVRGTPSALHQNSYPADVPNNWPIGEAYFPSRWVWAHNEYTPRQTMRGKMALYAYLHGVSQMPAPTNLDLLVTNIFISGGSGSVDSLPAGINCGSDCRDQFPIGTAISLTASAAPGSVFAGWEGACSGTAATCVVSMTSNRSVAARFEPIDHTYALTVGKRGGGLGNVSSTPAGIDCGIDCAEDYLSGTTVALEATAETDSIHSGWEGGCAGTGQCTVDLSQDVSVWAVFRPRILPEITVFDDALGAGWANWSYNAVIDVNGTSPVIEGAKAVNIVLGAWGAFSPALPSESIDTSGYTAIRFWVHGGSGTDKTLRVYTEGDREVSSYVDITAQANQWTEISISMDDLGWPETISRLYFTNYTANTINVVTLDDIRIVPDTPIFISGFESGGTEQWSSVNP